MLPKSYDHQDNIRGQEALAVILSLFFNSVRIDETLSFVSDILVDTF